MRWREEATIFFCVETNGKMKLSRKIQKNRMEIRANLRWTNHWDASALLKSGQIHANVHWVITWALQKCVCKQPPFLMKMMHKLIALSNSRTKHRISAIVQMKSLENIMFCLLWWELKEQSLIKQASKNGMNCLVNERQVRRCIETQHRGAHWRLSSRIFFFYLSKFLFGLSVISHLNHIKWVSGWCVYFILFALAKRQELSLMMILK